MFDKLMNNYYFGKSGKSDYSPDDLPTNRWQQFWEMLRIRFSALVRLNLIYVVVWIPLLLLLMTTAMGYTNVSSMVPWALDETTGTYYVDETLVGTPVMTRDQEGNEVESGLTYITSEDADEMTHTLLTMLVFLLIPCIAITGPATAGVCYVTRNWARDEHAFIWSDFKDAVKANWKQSLLVSLITSLIPAVVYMCWQFYGEMSATQPLMAIPQVLVLMAGVVWALAVTYMHPLIVSYDLKFRDIMRNAFLLAIARLPMSAGIRLLHALPMVLFVILYLFTPGWGMLVPFIWYVLIGLTLSRFITASYTNAVFDRFINSRIEGATVNRGLNLNADEDDDEDDEDEDAPEA